MLQARGVAKSYRKVIRPFAIGMSITLAAPPVTAFYTIKPSLADGAGLVAGGAMLSVSRNAIVPAAELARLTVGVVPTTAAKRPSIGNTSRVGRSHTVVVAASASLGPGDVRLASRRVVAVGIARKTVEGALQVAAAAVLGVGIKTFAGAVVGAAGAVRIVGLLLAAVGAVTVAVVKAGLAGYIVAFS